MTSRKREPAGGYRAAVGVQHAAGDRYQRNLATVTAINRDASQLTRHQALADAEGISYLYFLSDALGPRQSVSRPTTKGSLAKPRR
jgi:hypothetical protein